MAPCPFENLGRTLEHVHVMSNPRWRQDAQLSSHIRSQDTNHHQMWHDEWRRRNHLHRYYLKCITSTVYSSHVDVENVKLQSSHLNKYHSPYYNTWHMCFFKGASLTLSTLMIIKIIGQPQSNGWAKASACRLQVSMCCPILCQIVSLQYLSRVLKNALRSIFHMIQLSKSIT